MRTLLDVIEQYRLENALAPRVGIGDLSRRHGGDFGVRFGGLGHGSHQNGLDADVYYPRVDGLERRAYRPSQVDRAARAGPARPLRGRRRPRGLRRAEPAPGGPAQGGRAARAPRRPHARAARAEAGLRQITRAVRGPPYRCASVPRTSGRTASGRRADAGSRRASRRAEGAGHLSPPAHGQRAAGSARRARRPPGAAALLGERARPGRSPARPRGRGRRGDALGRGRRRGARRLGHDDAAPPARGAPGRLQRRALRAAVRLGLAGQPRRDPGARPPRRGRLPRRALPRLDRRRLQARRRGHVRLRPRRRRAPRVGAASSPTAAAR